MYGPWHPSLLIADIEAPDRALRLTSGIYVIFRGEPLNRAGGADPAGILYIGKTTHLLSRLRQFLRGGHTANSGLWANRSLFMSCIGGAWRPESHFVSALGRLRARVASPIRSSRLERAERVVLLSYVEKFGEVPPLNFALPGKYGRPPSAAAQRWANRGLNAAP
jgi:hypothetical protein